MLSGTIEITMKERRRVQAISVVIQSVSRLYMGGSRGWEEDGLFERGVEIIGEDAYGEALWLDQGTTSCVFSSCGNADCSRDADTPFLSSSPSPLLRPTVISLGDFPTS